ncbi:hypothetical protein NPIL_88912 [Nephila pilipes]|uniref:Uncharacterized protein n=1 Tax=Nephila pilipes TaxID=299642 RepID=A0A8X6I477_NEPPI|nr:hypothetical protein NPIL_88912 [Nephila pilipes]
MTNLCFIILGRVIVEPCILWEERPGFWEIWSSFPTIDLRGKQMSICKKEECGHEEVRKMCILPPDGWNRRHSHPDPLCVGMSWCVSYVIRAKK